MRALLVRLCLLALALTGGLATADGARAQDCPDITLLELGAQVYRAEALPASSGIAQGAAIGKGVVDAPKADNLCERGQTDVTVVSLEGIEQEVAVGVEGDAATIYVLGSKCFGFEGDARWACLRQPLELDGETYVGTRYPEGPGAARELPLGAPVAGGTIAGAPVDAVEIEGVDPSVAVGLAGKPDEAYVALGPCLYERFDRRPLFDDLRRCLEAPVWFLFEPPGAPPGDEATADADRTLRPELVGATVALARSTVAADVIPRGGTPVIVFTIDATSEGAFPFTVPELDSGRYEAVVECDACGVSADGKTSFPAGSFLVLEKSGASGGSTLTTIITVVVGLAFVVALGLSIYMWRRGRAARRASGGEPGAGNGPS